VTTLELSFSTAVLREACFVVLVFIEAKDARIAVAVGDEDREPSGAGTAAVIRHSLGALKPGLSGSGDLQHDAAVSLYLEKAPVRLGIALLHGGVEIFFSSLSGKDDRMNLWIRGCDSPEQAAVSAIHQNSRAALGADADASSSVQKPVKNN
jgi:hypothetical protein